MSFLTSHMEAMLAAATDPEEIALRRKVLDDHLAMQSTAAAPTVDLDPQGAGKAHDGELTL